MAGFGHRVTPLLAALQTFGLSSATSPARGAVGALHKRHTDDFIATAPLAGEVAQLRRSLSGARRGVLQALYSS
jgi:hypothetical protein